MSHSVAEIQAFLNTRLAGFVSAVRLNELSGTVLLEIPRDRLKNKSGSGFTSNRQLTFLSRAIENRFNLRVLTAFRDSQQHTDLESGLRAMLVRRFAGVVVDVRMSFPASDHALVWVTLGISPDATSADVQEHVTGFLLESKIVCDGIELLSPALPEPSTIAILRSVKTLAPVSLEGITADLRNRGMPSPSDRWLAGRLDTARKRGLLVRHKAGTYVLTARGLQAVPHTRSGSSSDVDRMLALAKRRQW